MLLLLLNQLQKCSKSFLLIGQKNVYPPHSDLRNFLPVFFMIIIYFLFFSTDLLPPESSCLTISLHACVVPFVVILFCHNIFVNLEYMYSVFCSKSPLPQTPTHTFNLPLTVEGLRKVLFSCPVVTKTYPEQAKFESCLSELQA